MEIHMCFLLVRYVYLIMQCTKQHIYNQIMVSAKLQTSLPQVSVMSDWAPEKVCNGRRH